MLNSNQLNQMSNTHWPYTEHSPMVVYNDNLKKLKITGTSFINEADVFYQPYIDSIYQKLSDKEVITIEFHLTSFGPKTAKVFFKLFDNLKFFKMRNRSSKIIWKYNEGDEAIMEMGHAFSELFELDFILEAN